MSVPILADLRALADSSYRAFHSKLVPTVDSERILGVRTPALRGYARQLAREHPGDARFFMAETPHVFYEENNLHGELIGLLCARDFEATLCELDRFLPQVDNWATCDLLAPKILAKHPAQTLVQVRDHWLASDHLYTVRFGINELMRDFLGERFEAEHLGWVASLPAGEYYLDMGRAWYFSMALVKQYDATIGMFEHPVLDSWTHNKALQKARESRRVSDETKAYLQGLKIEER